MEQEFDFLWSVLLISALLGGLVFLLTGPIVAVIAALFYAGLKFNPEE